MDKRDLKVKVNVNHDDFDVDQVIGSLENTTIRNQKVLLMDNVTFNKYISDIQFEEDNDEMKLVRDIIMFLVSSQKNYLIYKLRQENKTFEEIAGLIGLGHRDQARRRFNNTMNNKKIDELVTKFIETNNILADLKNIKGEC